MTMSKGSKLRQGNFSQMPIFLQSSLKGMKSTHTEISKVLDGQMIKTASEMNVHF